MCYFKRIGVSKRLVDSRRRRSLERLVNGDFMKDTEKKEAATLMDRVRNELTTEPTTIPELCEQFQEKDEIKIMRCIAELEIEGIATIVDFYKGFDPDGCAFYLARYARVKS